MADHTLKKVSGPKRGPLNLANCVNVPCGEGFKRFCSLEPCFILETLAPPDSLKSHFPFLEQDLESEDTLVIRGSPEKPGIFLVLEADVGGQVQDSMTAQAELPPIISSIRGSAPARQPGNVSLEIGDDNREAEQIPPGLDR
jgi:hypothetical protein